MTCRRTGEWKQGSTLLTSAVEVSGQVHAVATLPQRIKLPGSQDGCFGEQKNILFLPGNLDSSVI